MMSMLRSRLDRMPAVKNALKRFRQMLFGTPAFSTAYEEVKGAAASSESVRLRDSWQDADLPLRQRELVDKELASFRRGRPVHVFDVMVRALRTVQRDGQAGQALTVLEVGCSSGFYAEVFEIAGVGLSYAGCDYSSAFIDLARRTYPALPFKVEDATAMAYMDDEFDVVISGCCLLHIPDYERAVAEAARVARHYVVFHRTPVIDGEVDKYFRKLAYGVETIEIHFGELAFLRLLASHGLSLVETMTVSESSAGGASGSVKTYVSRVVTPAEKTADKRMVG